MDHRLWTIGKLKVTITYTYKAKPTSNSFHIIFSSDIETLFCWGIVVNLGVRVNPLGQVVKIVTCFPLLDVG